MADKYSKRPMVSRFKQKKTYAGRTVRKTNVVRRNMPMGRKGRAMKPMRAMRKGR